MATVGVKRFIIDNVVVQTKTGTAEYKTSGASKEAIIDDGSGDVIGFTQEKSAGMIKVQVSTLKTADTDKFRNLENGELVLEMIDGKTVVGSNMTQTADNPVTVADGIVEYEFMGNVKTR